MGRARNPLMCRCEYGERHIEKMSMTHCVVSEYSLKKTGTLLATNGRTMPRGVVCYSQRRIGHLRRVRRWHESATQTDLIMSTDELVARRSASVWQPCGAAHQNTRAPHKRSAANRTQPHCNVASRLASRMQYPLHRTLPVCGNRGETTWWYCPALTLNPSRRRVRA